MIQATSQLSSAHAVTTETSTTQSPFRQTEWDCRLDHLLQDLETSVSVNTPANQRSQSSERNTIPSPVTHEVNIEVVTPTAGQYSSVIKRLLHYLEA